MGYIWGTVYIVAFVIIIAICYWIERGGKQ